MNKIQIERELKILIKAMKIAEDNDSIDLIEALKKEIMNEDVKAVLDDRWEEHCGWEAKK